MTSSLLPLPGAVILKECSAMTDMFNSRYFTDRMGHLFLKSPSLNHQKEMKNRRPRLGAIGLFRRRTSPRGSTLNQAT